MAIPLPHSTVGSAIEAANTWKNTLGNYSTIVIAAAALVLVLWFVRKLVRLGRRSAATILGVGSLSTGAPSWALLRSWLHSKGWA